MYKMNVTKKQNGIYDVDVFESGMYQGKFQCFLNTWENKFNPFIQIANDSNLKNKKENSLGVGLFNSQLCYDIHNNMIKTEYFIDADRYFFDCCHDHEDTKYM